MSAISYLLGNVTSYFSTGLQEGVTGAIAAAPQALDLAPTAIQGSVMALAAVGGGMALMRNYAAPAGRLDPADLQDSEAVLEHVKQGRLTLSQVPHFCNDYEIVFAAIDQNPYEIQHTGPELRAQPLRFKQLAELAVQRFNLMQNQQNFRDWIVNSIALFRNGCIMQYLPEFRNDYDIIYLLVEQNPNAIGEAGPDLYQDPRFRELMLQAVQRNHFIVAIAGEFQNDYEIVGRAVASDPQMLQHAGEQLRESPEFAHLTLIAHLRTPIFTMSEDGPVQSEPRINYQEALNMLHVNPSTTLEKEILRWSNEYKKAFPSDGSHEDLEDRFQGVLTLKGNDRTNVTTYLQRIRTVQDYKNRGLGQKDIILRVDQMLRLASDNEGFRTEMINEMEEGLTDCDDNVLFRLNNIEVKVPLYNPDLNASEFRELAIRVERYEKITEYVKKYHPGPEELETALGLHLALKKHFNLPFSTKTMGHPSIAKLTPAIVEKATRAIENISDQELLAASPYWRERMALLKDLKEFFLEKRAEEKQEILKKNVPLARFLDWATAKGLKDPDAMASFLGEEKALDLAVLQEKKEDEIRERYMTLLEDLGMYFEIDEDEKKQDFLATNHTVRLFLELAAAKGVNPDYSAVAIFLGKEQDLEISLLR